VFKFEAVARMHGAFGLLHLALIAGLVNGDYYSALSCVWLMLHRGWFCLYWARINTQSLLVACDFSSNELTYRLYLHMHLRWVMHSATLAADDRKTFRATASEEDDSLSRNGDVRI